MNTRKNTSNDNDIPSLGTTLTANKPLYDNQPEDDESHSQELINGNPRSCSNMCRATVIDSKTYNSALRLDTMVKTPNVQSLCCRGARVR